MKLHDTCSLRDNYRTLRGFTLIELILVIGLLGIVLSFNVAISLSVVAQSSVVDERENFLSLVLLRARSHALANMHETSHGVRIDAEHAQYILFEGTSFNPSASNNIVIPFTNENNTVNHSSDATDIIFEQLSADVIAGAGKVTIQNGEEKVAVDIYPSGGINW
jgi:prepilin-type N-terminal cleavage/methylation domain-containing protein